MHIHSFHRHKMTPDVYHFR